MAPELWKPEVYQGARKRRRYFEGWYFKQVTAGAAESWSFIPGIARGEASGEGYSFVQAIEGATARSWWFEYPLAAFEASRRELRIRVGGNEFSRGGIRLALESADGRFEGEIGFGPSTLLPSPFLSPGVMGPFSFVPFMECRHGLVSLHHRLSGSLRHDGREIDFEGGRGYAEKDWGSSMPECWLWTQSNNFPAEGDSFMLSVARIPWLGGSFVGFLCAASLSGRLVREATYSGARLAEIAIGDESARVVIEKPRTRERFEVEARRARGGLLRAPVKGLLSRRIAESVDASLRLRWSRDGKLLFEGEAPKAGLEIVGDLAVRV
ncbi:MAG: hypothetical protein JNG85_15005 [Spirochaetaceae bacterium]|nr:hypothetical protein [Spirochaetaceae bacterium]